MAESVDAPHSKCSDKYREGSSPSLPKWSLIIYFNNKYKTMSLLIIGATGTIGRQIAKEALAEGFKVKCLVRSLRKGSFLKEWGAELVYGDLSIKQTLPKTLKGVTCIIDASTTRPYGFLTSEAIDWIGKRDFLEIAKRAKVKKYIFLSILGGHKNQHIPFIQLKLRFEKQLLASGIKFSIFYIPNLFQGVISQYAVAILDQQPIILPNTEKRAMYIDARDIANSVVKSLKLPIKQDIRIPLVTGESWNPREIVDICQKLSGQKAKVISGQNLIIELLASFFKLFKWSWSISEQLSFVDIKTKEADTVSYSEKNLLKESYMYDEGCLNKVDTSSFNNLDSFLKDYFGVMLRKLKELNIKRLEKPIF